MPLVVLAGLIVMVVGLVTSNPVRVVIGLALGALAGLELAVREHFSGYRSHSTLLAGNGFAVAIGVTGYGLRWPVGLCMLAGIVVFTALLILLRRRFFTASGGYAVKLR